MGCPFYAFGVDFNRESRGNRWLYQGFFPFLYQGDFVKIHPIITSGAQNRCQK